ncbi:unnamed protein product [Chrysoparadoxa australica]
MSNEEKESGVTMHETLTDCPLIEIVHFHECLRGELLNLQKNVHLLRRQVEEQSIIIGSDESENTSETGLALEVQSQFNLLWAVFQSHSTAEDEVIWPALKQKKLEGSAVAGEGMNHLDEQKYSDEHTQERELFESMSKLLEEARNSCHDKIACLAIMKQLQKQTDCTLTHLMQHLDKEESEALPLIRQYFSADEMADLVGRIMGKRPSQLMQTILVMMAKNLPPEEVGKMLGYMRQAVRDTYFEKWLDSGGFTWQHVHEAGMQRVGSGIGESKQAERGAAEEKQKQGVLDSRCSLSLSFAQMRGLSGQPTAEGDCALCDTLGGHCPMTASLSQQQFENAVRLISKVPNLPMEKKTNFVQALRGHMTAHASGKRARTGSGAATSQGKVKKGKGEGSAVEVDLLLPKRHYIYVKEPLGSNDIEELRGSSPSRDEKGRRKIRLVTGKGRHATPLFRSAELEPTHHHIPGSDHKVLGCPHYQRACKLRTPCCGRLFTCRLCHDQVMDHSMDRYQAKEMLCMHCGSLQPVAETCCNPDCSGAGAGAGAGAGESKASAASGESTTEHQAGASEASLARYFCGVCSLFDDAPEKDIYHCPYCNVCRRGKGLGVDFWHCMKCNACISMSITDHKCIAHSLESNCPICNVSMFESTQPIKGIRCGHFMHLSCYNEYIKQAGPQDFWYRCPICLKSMEDMTEYFSQLDGVVAAQPMPPEFSDWKAIIVCHDCEGQSTVPFHFCYHKCTSCGSYNTRVESQIRGDGDDNDQKQSV